MAVVFNIDFREGQWTQNSMTTTGWPNASTATPASPTSASTVLDAGSGLSVTVTSLFFGTASAGPNNLKLDPPNTAGFAFQNKGTGDRNTGNTLNNFQRIDFTFSNQVRLSSLVLGDIDRASDVTNPQWTDATTIQLWESAPGAFGTGINPDITLESTTFLTAVSTASSRFGVPFVYASSGANTINNDLRSVANFSSDSNIMGFSVYLWTERRATGGQHGIALRATGSEVISPVPEPAAFSIVGGIVALIFVGFRRRR